MPEPGPEMKILIRPLDGAGNNAYIIGAGRVGAQIKIEGNFRLWQGTKKYYYAFRVNSQDGTILFFFNFCVHHMILT